MVNVIYDENFPTQRDKTYVVKGRMEESNVASGKFEITLGRIPTMSIDEQIAQLFDAYVNGGTIYITDVE